MSSFIKITDFYDNRLDVYARLSERELLSPENHSESIFIAESPKVIERALNAGYQPISALIEDKTPDTETELVLNKLSDIPVFTAPFEVLTNLTGFNLTRGMLCAMKRKPLLSVEDIISGKSRVVILESIMNPTNVGAIFRSAAALNIDAVILTSDCSDPLYRRSVRVSMGNVFLIPWTISNSDDDYNLTELLKKQGFKSAAMALNDNSININDSALKSCDKLALFMGNEGNGLRNTTIENCDYVVKIPMSNNVDSLNVAAASAVAFWEIGKN